MSGEPKSRQRERQGVVVSDKMEKTIVVEVTSVKPHPLYQKIVRRTNRLKAHDESNEARIGDTVLVRECRPLARSKFWRLVQILERAK
ncbi:MAG: 30S ribosomal protein S17 [Actinobacteria bacterium]|nr:30S ribosomal protein S17 [Actinomycetota bacterium]OPZ77951.1 MAG: 30S ribosomal protein S17 [Actinobacteria bacterium ADurb.Bin444]